MKTGASSICFAATVVLSTVASSWVPPYVMAQSYPALTNTAAATTATTATPGQEEEPAFQSPPPVYSTPPDYPVYGGESMAPSYRQPGYTGGYQGYGYAQGGNYAMPSYRPTYGVPPSYGGYAGQGYPAPGAQVPAPENGYAQPAQQEVYAPQGTVIPVELSTSISTQVTKPGDYIQATLTRNVPLSGFFYLPAGSVVSGEVTRSSPGRFFQRSGLLGIAFNNLRCPDGRSFPIQAHVVGSIAKYANKSGVYRGEGFGAKAGNFLLRSVIGAGAGAALGTAVGAIAGGGHGVGRGAWSGTAIGGGVGLLDDLVLRKGKNVLIHAGTPMQIELDQPLTFNAYNNVQNPASGAI
jgi:hypothetical protein